MNLHSEPPLYGSHPKVIWLHRPTTHHKNAIAVNVTEKLQESAGTLNQKVEIKFSAIAP